MLRDLSDLAAQLPKLLAAGVNHTPIDYAAWKREAQPEKTPPRKPADGEA